MSNKLKILQASLEELHIQFPELNSFQEGQIWNGVKQIFKNAFNPKTPAAVTPIAAVTPAAVTPTAVITPAKMSTFDNLNQPTGLEDLEHLSVDPNTFLPQVLGALKAYITVKAPIAKTGTITTSATTSAIVPSDTPAPKNPGGATVEAIQDYFNLLRRFSEATNKEDIKKFKGIISGVLNKCSDVKTIMADPEKLKMLQTVLDYADTNGIKIPGIKSDTLTNLEHVVTAMSKNGAQGNTGPVQPLNSKDDLIKALNDNPAGATTFVNTLKVLPKNGPTGSALATLMQKAE